MRVDLLDLEYQNQAKNIPVSLPSSPNKIWGKSVQGFLSYDLTNKQTNRQSDRQMAWKLLNYKNFFHFLNDLYSDIRLEGYRLLTIHALQLFQIQRICLV